MLWDDLFAHLILMRLFKAVSLNQCPGKNKKTLSNANAEKEVELKRAK